MFQNTIARLFAPKKSRRTQPNFTVESLELRVVLSAVSISPDVSESTGKDDAANTSAEDHQLRGFAIADLGVRSTPQGLVLQGLATSPVGFADNSESSAPVEAPVLRGLSSSPLGFRTLAPAASGQDSESAASSETADDPTVLRGLASSPLGLRGLADSPLSATSQRTADSTQDDSANEDDPTTLRGFASSPMGGAFGLPGDTHSFHADIFADGFESGNTSL